MKQPKLDPLDSRQSRNKKMLVNPLDIIEHLEKGIQPLNTFSIFQAYKWAKSCIDLLRENLPEYDRSELVGILGLRNYHGNDFNCDKVNLIYQEVIDDVREILIKELEK